MCSSEMHAVYNVQLNFAYVT